MSEPAIRPAPLRGARVHRIAVLALFAAGLAAAPRLLPIGHADFDKAYHPAARAVWTSGSFEYTYAGFKNLPIVAGLLAPLGALERTSAQRLFLGFELLCLLASFALSLALFSREPVEDWLLLALFATSRHAATCLRLGQLTPLCLVLVLLVFAALRRGRLARAGLFQALAFLIKLPVGGLALSFALRRQWRALAAAAATVAAALAASLALFGAELHADYLRFAVLENAGRTLTAHNNPTFAAAWARFPATAGLFDWSMVEVSPVANAAVAALLLALGVRLWRSLRGPRVSQDVGLAAALCLSLLLLPVSWDHYYLLLLPPLALSGLAIRRRGPPRGLALAWLAVFALQGTPVLQLLLWGGRPLAASALGAWLPSLPLLGCAGLFWLLTGPALAPRS